jgi:Fe-S-cluster containining protein
MAGLETLQILNEEALECDRCGACCSTFFVQVSEQDAELEPRIKAASIVVEPWLQSDEWRYRLHPLPFHEGCCFLGSNKLCAIYQSRPQVCRRFKAGSQQCQEARALKGLEPLCSA